MNTESASSSHKLNSVNKNVRESGNVRKSYANMVKNGEILINKELMFIAPKISEDRVVSVLFDEEILKKGSLKWQNIICGSFVGHNMWVNELRYHIRRMWGSLVWKS